MRGTRVKILRRSLAGLGSYQKWGRRTWRKLKAYWNRVPRPERRGLKIT